MFIPVTSPLPCIRYKVSGLLRRFFGLNYAGILVAVSKPNTVDRAAARFAGDIVVSRDSSHGDHRIARAALHTIIW